MYELTSTQRSILGSLLFTESFAHILEETKGDEWVIADELKQLIDRRLVQVMEPDGKGGHKATFFYDTDNMHAFSYCATGRGIAAYDDR